MATSGVAGLHSELRKVGERLEIPSPEFQFTIGWSDTYDALFGKSYRSSTSIAGLPVEARQRGRVILHAEGGAGKTMILHRVYRDRLADDEYPVLIDLRGWRPPLFDAWKYWRSNAMMRMRLLLTDMAATQVDESLLDSLPTGHSSFILVDGLNEVPADIAPGILDCVDAFARRHPTSSVIVTDRLVRRDLPGEGWALATIRISDEEIARVRNQPRTDKLSGGLLGTAFFLDLALKKGLDSTSGSKAFAAYFEHQLRFSREQLDHASSAAFRAYTKRSSRTFEFREFAKDAGEATTAALMQSGTIIQNDSFAYFKHHLFHDYLASVWLAQHRDSWNAPSFDAVTFRASSFDALALALEQIEKPNLADRFLRQVYDWNFYGSIYALVKGRSLGSVTVSVEMELALLAVLAERRWDILRVTAERVTDALRIFPSSLAQRLLKAPDFDAVLAIVRAAKVVESTALKLWRRVFTISPGSQVSDDIVDLLRNPNDSLVGWTVANVLKRAVLSNTQLVLLRQLLVSHADRTVRWRAAHALGAHPSAQSVDALFGALSDEYHWVRYGAIRSIVECAARDAALRTPIFERLRRQVRQIAQDERTVEELEKCLLLTSPPRDWTASVEGVLEELWATAETLERQDHWRWVAYQVQRSGSAP